MTTATKQRVTKDGEDVWDLLGPNPGAFGLIDWSNIPSWDVPPGESPGTVQPPPAWTGEGDTPGLPGGQTVTPGSPGDPGSAPGGTSGLPPWLSGLGSQFLRMLGIGGAGGAGGAAGGAGGSTGLLNLLSILAGGYGAYSGNQATHEAADAMRDANTRALDFAQGQLGAGDERMRPYTDIGREAVWNLNAMGPRPLAQNYRPLNTGRGIVGGGVTLGQLAKGR